MRISLRLSGSALKLMQRLIKRFNSEPKDVVLESLALMNMAADQLEEEGSQLSVRNKKGDFMAISTPGISTFQLEVKRAAAAAAVNSVEVEEEEEEEEEPELA